MVFKRNVPPSLNPEIISYFPMYAGTEHATKLGCVTKYVDLIGDLLNLKWDLVTPPDFLESYAKYPCAYKSVLSPIIFIVLLN